MYDKFIRAMSHSLLIVRESIRSFQKNNNLDEAASLAYYGFFAFIPLFFIEARKGKSMRLTPPGLSL